MFKSLESVIALYGIMKAGCAYVPLDPNAPEDRLKRIVAECRLSGLAIHPATAKRANLFAQGEGSLAVFGAEAEFWETLGARDANVVSLPTPSPTDLAYIMFTSGSTGTPKGIQHTHHSGLAYARMAASLYGLTPDDRLGNHSPFHFDMSTFEVFAGPVAGACSVLIPEAHARLPASLSQLVEAEKLTVWYSVPFAISQLVDHGALAQRNISALRWVIFGGEPIQTRYLRALAKHAPRARFSNSYGPAEVNQCTYFHASAQDIELLEKLPLGGPCPHAELKLVDHDGQDADRGELLVKTEAMMRGYWGSAQADGEVFCEERSGRWYRTGDLVERQPGGELVFLGRLDRQVKLRGHRIELEEVEAVLSELNGVVDACAAVRADQATLCAFVQIEDGDGPSAQSLRAYAGKHLPRYACPSEYIFTDTFPRTASGKIDRAALAKTLEAPCP